MIKFLLLSSLLIVFVTTAWGQTDGERAEDDDADEQLQTANWLWSVRPVYIRYGGGGGGGVGHYQQHGGGGKYGWGVKGHKFKGKKGKKKHKNKHKKHKKKKKDKHKKKDHGWESGHGGWQGGGGGGGGGGSGGGGWQQRDAQKTRGEEEVISREHVSVESHEE